MNWIQQEYLLGRLIGEGKLCMKKLGNCETRDARSQT